MASVVGDDMMRVMVQKNQWRPLYACRVCKKECEILGTRTGTIYCVGCRRIIFLRRLGYILPELAADQGYGEFHNQRHIYTSGAPEGINNSDCMHTQRAREFNNEIAPRYAKKRVDLEAWLQAIGDLGSQWGYADVDGGCEAAVEERKHGGGWRESWKQRCQQIAEQNCVFEAVVEEHLTAGPR